MICDAHIHVGYYNRYGQDGPFYYSPRRVCSVLKKCGVGEFIYSSMSMQTIGIKFDDVHKEMLEARRLFGNGAHPFLWVSRGYRRVDPAASLSHLGFYEGIKLHGLEMSWIVDGDKLEPILATAEKYKKPVMVHAGHYLNTRPVAQNVFVDVSCMSEIDAERFVNSAFTDRVLWGTDFPTLAARSGESLTANMRRSIATYNRFTDRIDFAGNFHRYLKGDL